MDSFPAFDELRGRNISSTGVKVSCHDIKGKLINKINKKRKNKRTMKALI